MAYKISKRLKTPWKIWQHCHAAFVRSLLFSLITYLKWLIKLSNYEASTLQRLTTHQFYAGSEFVALPRKQQIEILKTSRGCVFSRAEPRHKQVCVRACVCVLSVGVGVGGGGARVRARVQVHEHVQLQITNACTMQPDKPCYFTTPGSSFIRTHIHTRLHTLHRTLCACSRKLARSLP